jgi:hypothetical protein
MPEPYIDEGETYIHGKTPETARRLLAAAEALELDASVVRTTQGGFIVPTEVDEWTDTGPKSEPVAEDETPEGDAAEIEVDGEPVEPGEDGLVTLPTEPNKGWSHADLDAYADEHGIHLNAGLNKADKIAALTATKESD